MAGSRLKISPVHQTTSHKTSMLLYSANDGGEHTSTVCPEGMLLFVTFGTDRSAGKCDDILKLQMGDLVANWQME